MARSQEQTSSGKSFLHMRIPPPPPPPPPARCEDLRKTHRRVLRVPTPARSGHCQQQGLLQHGHQQEVVPCRETPVLQEAPPQPYDANGEAAPSEPFVPEPEDM